MQSPLIIGIALQMLAGHAVMASVQNCKGPSLVVMFALFESALSL